MADNAKLDDAVAARFAADPDALVEVLLVLAVPQPDLSFLLTEKTRDYSKAVIRPPGSDADKAMDRVMSLLEGVGAAPARRLDNAQALFVTLNREQLDEVLGFQDIQEVSMNAKLE